MRNKVKQKLRNGDKSIGAFISFYSPFVTELIGHAGFDFLLIDSEHGAFSHTEIEHMIISAENVNLTPIVRVSYDPSSIQKALDSGAKGIQVPMVNTKEQAEEIVKNAKYPPVGNRGISYSIRAARYGLDRGEKYINTVNQETLVSIQIETAEAVKNFNEILSVPGIDIIFVGTNDLAVNLGYAESGPNHPDIQKITKDLFSKAKNKEIHVGTFASDVEGLETALNNGVDYIGATATSLAFSAFKEMTTNWENLNK